jgi:hypothetical protein
VFEDVGMVHDVEDPIGFRYASPQIAGPDARVAGPEVKVAPVRMPPFATA